MDATQLSQLFQSAAETKRAADAVQAELEAVLLAALRRLIPAGTLVDRRLSPGNPKPDYLVNLKTMAGSDRGAHQFRIEQVVDVEVKPGQPGLSRWSCDATPISPKTGKDMLASSGNRKAGTRTTVRLAGYLSIDRDCVEHGQEIQYLSDLFASK